MTILIGAHKKDDIFFGVEMRNKGHTAESAVIWLKNEMYRMLAHTIKKRGDTTDCEHVELWPASHHDP